MKVSHLIGLAVVGAALTVGTAAPAMADSGVDKIKNEINHVLSTHPYQHPHKPVTITPAQAAALAKAGVHHLPKWVTVG